MARFVYAVAEGDEGFKVEVKGDNRGTDGNFVRLTLHKPMNMAEAFGAPPSIGCVNVQLSPDQYELFREAVIAAGSTKIGEDDGH